MKKLLPFIAILLSSFQLISQVQISGIVNHYGVVTSIEADSCAAKITVDDSAPFDEGNLVVLIQMQGAEIDESNSSSFGNVTSLNSAGLYEINEIANIVGNDIIFKNRIENEYQVSGSVQLVTMPTYDAVEIQDSLTAMPWDGERGGIVAINVEGELIQNGNIDVSGLGFRGGETQTSATNDCNWLFTQNNYFYEFGNWRGAAKGEGIAPIIVDKEFGRGAQANGGGGGNDHNSGGGGGGNITNGGVGGENNEPSTFGCQGSFPGIGGKGAPTIIDRIFLGGGGGAGHDNNGVATNGGNGGGIIIINTNQFNPSDFSILANGNTPIDGGGDGTGGGGAGGSILLLSQNISSTVHLEANGGDGGLNDNNGVQRCFGPGGGGGGGIISTNLSGGASFTTSVNGGEAGMTINSGSCSDNTNGATDGESGIIENINNIIFASQPTAMPVANFTYANVGASFQFNSTSLNANSFQWSFGDANGNVSTMTSPTFEYSENGAYTVQLIVSNDCGTDTIEQVVEYFFPIVSFTSSDTNGCAPYLVTYTNSSTGLDNQYVWTFEGGTPATSSEENPQIIYETPGVYDVTLQAVNTYGTDQFTLQDVITIIPAPVASFDFTIDGNVVTFNNTSSEAITYTWNFGDGFSSTSENPSHQYNANGMYIVSLTASKDFCHTTIVDTIDFTFVNTKNINHFDVTIFPNPTSYILNIITENDTNLNARIFSIDGKPIPFLEQDFQGTISLDLKNIPSGIYFLELSGGEKIYRHRFVKF